MSTKSWLSIRFLAQILNNYHLLVRTDLPNRAISHFPPSPAENIILWHFFSSGGKALVKAHFVML